MTLQQSRRLQSLLLGTLAWAIAILIFFPIFWMVLTSFKTEIDAFATPPQFIFAPTLENYLHINERSNYFSFAWNSVVISFSATALCLLIAVPAASPWRSMKPSAPKARCCGCSPPKCCHRWVC